MAMTKAEQARVAALETDLAMARAMAWPSYRCPSPMTEQDIAVLMKSANGAPARGWFANPYNGRVTFGCSTLTSHNPEGDKTTTQKMGRMYVTELTAYEVLRHEVTRRVANDLARIDHKIAELSSGGR